MQKEINDLLSFKLQSVPDSLHTTYKLKLRSWAIFILVVVDWLEKVLLWMF